MTLKEERLAQRIPLREYCIQHGLDPVQRSREERAEYPAEPRDAVGKLPAVPPPGLDVDALLSLLDEDEAAVEAIRQRNRERDTNAQ